MTTTNLPTRRPCMDSSKLGADPLMYSKSVVKTSYDRGSIFEMVLQKSGMMDCKSMENSHDDISEEVERL
jgi:hypothetical protein